MSKPNRKRVGLGDDNFFAPASRRFGAPLSHRSTAKRKGTLNKEINACGPTALLFIYR